MSETDARSTADSKSATDSEPEEVAGPTADGAPPRRRLLERLEPLLLVAVGLGGWLVAALG